MADAAPTSAGEARVWAAVALGWQVARLYHSPVHQGPVMDPAQNGRLPGFSGFSAATRDGDARRYLRMLTARAMTRATVTIDTPACSAMAPLAQRDSGMTSVGLKAVALVNATYR